MASRRAAGLHRDSLRLDSVRTHHWGAIGTRDDCCRGAPAPLGFDLGFLIWGFDFAALNCSVAHAGATFAQQGPSPISSGCARIKVIRLRLGRSPFNGAPATPLNNNPVHQAKSACKASHVGLERLGRNWSNTEGTTYATAHVAAVHGSPAKLPAIPAPRAPVFIRDVTVRALANSKRPAKAAPWAVTTLLGGRRHCLCVARAGLGRPIQRFSRAEGLSFFFLKSRQDRARRPKRSDGLSNGRPSLKSAEGRSGICAQQDPFRWGGWA